jgi:hypothetical protein
MRCSVIRLRRLPEMKLGWWRRAATVCATSACLTTIAMAAPALAVDEAVTAQVVTAHPTVGQDLELDGQVTGAPTYPASVTTTRDDSTGTQTPVGMPVMTDDQGNFTVHDTPPARGQVTYHLTTGNGATTDVPTTVAGKKVDLTIRVSPAPADAESTVQVVAHLGSPTTNRDLTLYATPYRGSRQQFDSGPVDANGDRTASRAVHRRTTFTVVFAGDSAYAPASARKRLRVRGVLDEALKGWYRSSGGTKLYHHDDNPSLAVHLLPEHKGSCLYFRAEHRRHGHWVRSAVSTCVRTDSTGRAIGVLTGDHIVGVPYRLRAEWHGTKAVDGRKGAWMHLKFR